MTSVRDHGTRWSHIVKLLPGRSDNAIKNRYYSAVRKAHRQDQRLCGGDKPMTSAAAASPLAEAAVVSAADEEQALAVGTPPPQLALALPPEEGVAHLQAWQAAQRGVELRHSQPALPPPPPLPPAATEGGPSPGRPAGRGAKGSPARPKGSPSKRKRKAEAEDEEDEEDEAAGAAGAAVTATAVMAQGGQAEGVTEVMVQSGWVHRGVVPLQVVQAGWVHGEGGSPDGYDVAQEGLRPAFGSVAEPLGMPSVVCLPDEPMSPDLDASPPRVFENPPESMPAAAPPIAPHVAPPLVAAAAPTPPLVVAELPSTQTVHMSSVHMTHTPLAMHSTQLPPSLASSGGQITLGMPAGYAHSSCAPAPCHSSGYSHGGGATSEGP